MQNALDRKIVWITPPAAIIDNASATTASIDTKGFDRCDIYVGLGALDIALAAFKVQQSDTDSNYADVTGGSFASGTQPDGSATTLPAATDDNKWYRIGGSLNGMKRYLDLVLTLGDGAAGTYVVAFAILSRSKEAPNTTAERGLAQEINW